MKHLQIFRYCSVEEFERNMTVIYACTERNQVTYPTMRANILSIIKSVCAFITVLFLLPVLVIYSFIPAIHDLEVSLKYQNILLLLFLIVKSYF